MNCPEKGKYIPSKMGAKWSAINALPPLEKIMVKYLVEVGDIEIIPEEA